MLVDGSETKSRLSTMGAMCRFFHRPRFDREIGGVGLHIDGREDAVSDGTADGTGEGEPRVQVHAGELGRLIGLDGLLYGLDGCSGGRHVDGRSGEDDDDRGCRDGGGKREDGGG